MKSIPCAIKYRDFKDYFINSAKCYTTNGNLVTIHIYSVWDIADVGKSDFSRMLEQH